MLDHFVVKMHAGIEFFFLKQRRRLRSAHHCIKEGENKSVKTQAKKKKKEQERTKNTNRYQA